MGFDVIGWRDCDLQAGVDPQEFIRKRKLMAYKAVIETNRPPDEREGAKVKLAISGGVQALSYEQLQRDLDGFEQGVPECKTCPLAQSGAPVSCYRFITYPIDQAFEELVFSYYYTTVSVSGSPAQTITDESIAAELRRDSSPFHERGAGAIAERDEPLLARFNGGKLVIDSAHLLCCLFGLAEDPPSIDTQVEFGEGFFEWIETLGDVAEPNPVEAVAIAALEPARAKKALAEYHALVGLLRATLDNDWDMHGHG